MKIKDFLQRHSLLTYFILAYVISWGGIILVIGPSGFQIFHGVGVLSEGFAAEKMLGIWLAMLAGPCLGCFLLTGLLGGGKALKQLMSSMAKLKVNVKWYAAALFIIPAILAVILYGLTSVSSNYTPGLMVVFGILVGFIGGSVEELGWTGFALPRLQLKYSPLVAGIILGVIHTFWHFLSDYWGGIGFYKDYFFFHFFLWIVALTAYRLLSVWIYNHTKSLFLAQLTHASFTGGQLVFGPPRASASEAVIWYALFAAVLLTVIGIIILKDKKSFMQKVVA